MKQISKKKIILDTNVLVLLIIGRIDQSYITKYIRTKQFSKNEYLDLENFLNNYDSIIITKYILAEFSHLTIEERSLKRIYKKRIKEMLIALYRDKFVDLSPKVIKILSSEILFPCGVSDSSLCEVSLDKNIAIISSDGVFADIANNKGYTVYKFIPTEGFVNY